MDSLKMEAAHTPYSPFMYYLFLDVQFKQDDLLSAGDKRKQLTGPFPFGSLICVP